MRPVLAYTAARILLFAATVGVLYLLGARGLLLLALAVLVSGLVSFVLLSRQRDAMSNVVLSRSGALLANVRKGRRKLEEKLEAARTKEDPPAS